MEWYDQHGLISSYFSLIGGGLCTGGNADEASSTMFWACHKWLRSSGTGCSHPEGVRLGGVTSGGRCTVALDLCAC